MSHYLTAKTALHYKVLVFVISRFSESHTPVERAAHKKLKTLTWILRSLLTAFAIMALMSVLGFLAIGAILFNPFILVTLGMAVIVIAAMMKNTKDVR